MLHQTLDSVRPGNLSHSASDKVTMERAILGTLAYADIFDFPLTAREVHKYLIQFAASSETVQTALENGNLVPRHLTYQQGFFSLHGRESIIETRLHRAEIAANTWPQARHYGKQIAKLPFVRMVAVTGGLAMENAEASDDIDYLIVTKPGRLWLCRAIIIALVVKPAARRGDTICPNYLLSERALVVQQRNLFTAHELVQMVPIAGLTTYHRLRQLNSWTADYLPNAGKLPRRAVNASDPRRPLRSLTESILRTPIGAWLEQWEMARKVNKLNQQADDRTESAFSTDWCKGHFDNHSELILQKFARRLQELEA